MCQLGEGTLEEQLVVLASPGICLMLPAKELSDQLKGQRTHPEIGPLGPEPPREQPGPLHGGPGSPNSEETCWPPPSLWLSPPHSGRAPLLGDVSPAPPPREHVAKYGQQSCGELGLTGGGAAPGWDLWQLRRGKGIGGEGYQEVGTLTHTPYMAPGHLQD